GHGICANVDNRICIALASSSAVISSSSTTGVARALLWSFGKITLLLSFSIAWVEVFSLSNNGNCDKRRAVINSFFSPRERTLAACSFIVGSLAAVSAFSMVFDTALALLSASLLAGSDKSLERQCT